MEQESGEDPEHDGPAGSQPPPDSSQPGDTDVPASGAGSAGADASDDADAGTADDGESEFGPWDALEGALGAAREREELLAGFAPGGVWDKHPPGPELAAAVARAAGPDWRCAVATGEERIGRLRGSPPPAGPASSCCCGTGPWTCRGPGWSPRSSGNCPTRTAPGPRSCCC